MGAPRLRIYYGPHEETATTVYADTVPMHSSVKVPLGEVLPLLVEAVQKRRGWVDDFDDDEITISTDLYEVLMAYQHFRRPPA